MAPELQAGDPAPDFTAPANDGRTVALSALRGRPVVLYFYPKDATPGCTQEACDFRDLRPKFAALGAEILGVSRDSVKSHEKFAAKEGLTFPLLSDPDETICRAYDVIREKTLYGRKSIGIERSTFLIDGEGRIAKAWRAVKVKGHAEEVLAAAATL